MQQRQQDHILIEKPFCLQFIKFCVIDISRYANVCGSKQTCIFYSTVHTIPEAIPENTIYGNS